MIAFNRFGVRRRVFIDHAPGRVSIRITHQHRPLLAIFAPIAATVGFALSASIFLRPFRGSLWSSATLYLGFLLLLLTAAYLIVLRMVLWAAFGEEAIVVENDVVRWTCTSLWLKDQLHCSTGEVSAVREITSWHGYNNHVEFIARGRSYRIGEKIWNEDAARLAHALKHAVHLH